MVVRGAVAVRVDGALEPGEQLSEIATSSSPVPWAAGWSPATRIGSTRSPAATRMPASAVPLRLAAAAARVGGGRGVASRSTAS